MAAAGTNPNAITVTPPPGKDYDLFSGDNAMGDFFSEADNFTNVLPPEVGNPAPILQGNASSGTGGVPYPNTDIPEVSSPGLADIAQVDGPGFGPIVPDTTTDPVNADTQVPLFTEENMGADQTGDFLQGYADRAPEVAANETMQGQLEQILNQDNALFDWARGQAAQYANSRGLLNSDIAAEASSQAVMGAALPIAQFDAGVYAQAAAQERQFWHTAGLQAFDATIQSGLMAQDHMNRMVEMSHQGDINSRLQLEQFGYNWQLSEQDNMHQMQQLALQGDIQSRLALQQFGFDVSLMEQDFGYRVRLADIDLRNALTLSGQDHEQWLDRMAQQHVNNLSEIAASGASQIRVDDARARNQAELDRLNNDARLDQIGAQGEQDANRQDDSQGFALQQQYLGMVERRNSEFNNEIQNIYSNDGLTIQQQNNAVNNATARYEADMDFYANMFTGNPNWDPNWIVSNQSAGPNPNTGGGDPPVVTPPYTPPPPPTGPPPIGPPGPGIGPDLPAGLPPWKYPDGGGSDPRAPSQPLSIGAPTTQPYKPPTTSFAPAAQAPAPTPTRIAPTDSRGIRSGGARR